MLQTANINYPFTSMTAWALAKNKAEATKYVRRQRLNAPDTLTITAGPYDQALVRSFLQRHGRVIVKPLDSSLSRGLTTDITTFEALGVAIEAARQHSTRVLVQEQVFGEEIRFATINGRVVSALLRRTPRVIGDGTSTVAELIKVENEQRRLITDTLVPYPQLEGALIRQSLDQTVVPAKGEVVELSRATMIGKGCSVYDVLDDLHPSYIEKVERLVKDINASFFVTDIFIRDYTQPASDDNYWFIEFNTSPVLKLFYSCRDGNMHDIVPVLAREVDRKLHLMSKPIVGSFEPVTFPALGITDQIAKIDTGAYSGTIGCAVVRVVQRSGRDVLECQVVEDGPIYYFEKFYVKAVRSSNGHKHKRYLIDTKILLSGIVYPVTIGVSDRSDMKHNILIGRRFLRANNILVDVTLNQAYDTDKEPK
jgi:D-alanine-D-alanine ligase-like ATP-grasp enzyme